MVEQPPSHDVAQLVGEHYQNLYRYAYRLTGSAADAEDLVQQVFLVAQTRPDRFEAVAHVRGWLFAVLRNAFFKQQQRRGRVVLASDVDLSLDHLPEEVAAESVFDAERLQTALDGLSPDFRVIVLMFYFEQCSYLEIAEQLDLPIGTVMSRLSRAKSHLRNRLCEPTLARRG